MGVFNIFNQFFKCVLSCSIHVKLLDSYFNLGAGIPSIVDYESDGSDDAKDYMWSKCCREKSNECQREIEVKERSSQSEVKLHIFLLNCSCRFYNLIEVLVPKIADYKLVKQLKGGMY